MPLTFMRMDAIGNVRRIWYRDEFGQPRFFELDMFLKSDGLAKDLIRQVNELLARPRPATSGNGDSYKYLCQHGATGSKYVPARVEVYEQEIPHVDKLRPDDVEYIDGMAVLR